METKHTPEQAKKRYIDAKGAFDADPFHPTSLKNLEAARVLYDHAVNQAALSKATEAHK